MTRAISISINPNFEADDFKFKQVGSLEERISKYFEKKVVLTEKGRDGLRMLVEAYGIKKGDEVLIQAFTCSVVPMAVLASGAKVVYVDIDENYNIDLSDLQKKITSRSKMVVVQHTFGMPVDMEKLTKVVGDKLIVVEDLAHGLGNTYKNKKLGQWGDASVLSFGRDKVISGVWGGAVVANAEIIKKIRIKSESLPKRSNGWVRKQINYVYWSEWSMKLYRLGIGKIMHWWARKYKWFDEPLTVMEKKGVPLKMYQGISDEISSLICRQWDKIDKFINKRKEIARRYATNLSLNYDDRCSYLRYSIEVNDADGLRRFAARKNVFLGDWYDQVIAPKSVDPKMFEYLAGSCPHAEAKSKVIVNLPTYPRMTNGEVDRVISLINEWKLKK